MNGAPIKQLPASPSVSSPSVPVASTTAAGGGPMLVSHLHRERLSRLSGRTRPLDRLILSRQKRDADQIPSAYISAAETRTITLNLHAFTALKSVSRKGVTYFHLRSVNHIEIRSTPKAKHQPGSSDGPLAANIKGSLYRRGEPGLLDAELFPWEKLFTIQHSTFQDSAIAIFRVPGMRHEAS
jgi:hypothetical protein